MFPIIIYLDGALNLNRHVHGVALDMQGRRVLQLAPPRFFLHRFVHELRCGGI